MMLKLEPRLQRIMDAEFPRYSAAEMARRRAAFERIMAEADCPHALIVGLNRTGSGVQWLTGWPATTEAMVVLSPGKRDAMYVMYHNHLPLAQRVATDADVRSGGQGSIRGAIEELKRRGGDKGRVGIVGPATIGHGRALTEAGATIVDLNAAYTRLRLIKSEEEIDWLRIGAALCDAGITALRANLKSGLNERALGDIVERAYVPYGAGTVIHFFGVTSMAAPDCGVPRQFLLNRRVDRGDVVFIELSASFWDHSGQVLRSFAVEADPPPLYRKLHETAEAAYDAIVAAIKPGAKPADLVAASGVIEDAGFTAIDDIVHGYGGGYLPPVLGAKSRPAGPIPDFTLQPGMCFVVQPNVTTKDGKAGVQTGELVTLTPTGAKSLHQTPRGFIRVG
jgi:Xaa-Pro aminopeptidase